MTNEMTEFFYGIADIFYFLEEVKILGISLVTWFVIFIVLSAVVLFIRGNK